MTISIGLNGMFYEPYEEVIWIIYPGSYIGKLSWELDLILSLVYNIDFHQTFFGDMVDGWMYIGILETSTTTEAIMTRLHMDLNELGWFDIQSYESADSILGPLVTPEDATFESSVAAFPIDSVNVAV